MPRKPASELKNNEEIKESVSTEKAVKKAPSKRASTVKKSTSVEKKEVTPKKSTSSVKKETTTKKSTSSTKKEATAKKPTSSTKKETAAKKATGTKKSTSTTKKFAKSASKKATTEKAATKKTTTKRTSTKKTTTEKTKTKKSTKKTDVNDITSTTDLTKKVEVLEYYDLPYRYNQTVVKVLAQTPTTLFIYWDISDVDRNNLLEQYGQDFFNNTKPVLIIHNNTMNYSFEIDIDDFANSWYLHVNDSNCEYTVELGRRAKYYNEEKHIEIQNNYLYVTSSNTIDSPNDHILFDKNLKTVYFKDVKTNIVTAKDITSISFLRNMGRIYDLYDLQANENNLNDGNHLQLDLRNPSSSTSSSSFR